MSLWEGGKKSCFKMAGIYVILLVAVELLW